MEEEYWVWASVVDAFVNPVMAGAEGRNMNGLLTSIGGNNEAAVVDVGVVPFSAVATTATDDCPSNGASIGISSLYDDSCSKSSYLPSGPTGL